MIILFYFGLILFLTLIKLEICCDRFSLISYYFMSKKMFIGKLKKKLRKNLIKAIILYLKLIKYL